MDHKKNNSTKKCGFTLVELLVSVSIIAILTAAGIASYNTAGARGRDRKRIADVQALFASLTSYLLVNLGNDLTEADVSTWNDLMNALQIPQKLRTLPPQNAGNDRYCYMYNSNTDRFLVAALNLEMNTEREYTGLTTGFVNVIGVTGTGADYTTCDVSVNCAVPTQYCLLSE